MRNRRGGPRRELTVGPTMAKVIWDFALLAWLLQVVFVSDVAKVCDSRLSPVAVFLCDGLFSTNRQRPVGAAGIL